MALYERNTVDDFTNKNDGGFYQPFEIVNIIDDNYDGANGKHFTVRAWVLDNGGNRTRLVVSKRNVKYDAKSDCFVLNFRTYKIYFRAIYRNDGGHDYKIVTCAPYVDGASKNKKCDPIILADDIKPESATDDEIANSVKVINKIEKKYDGEVKHEKYNQIKSCLSVDIPVYLAGPAGCGKNYTVEQICKEMGWGFYFSNSVQQEYKLTGFVDANGKFHDTEFYKACTDENECVFFLDEMDASIPDVLILLNAAIANGYFEFPTGKVTLDKVHFVAAGNTVGNGADELYTGRAVIDQATLDRFAIIEFDYSEKVELGITNGNSELVNFVHSLRDQAQSNGIRATFSYRCLSMVTELEKTGELTLSEILTIAVFKGLDADTVATFRRAGDGRYWDAFRAA